RKSLEELIAKYGDWPSPCRTVETPHGGHVWFPHFPSVKNSVGKLAPGLDVRGEGGYVVAPPSVLPDGCYRFAASSGAMTPAPQWLVSLALAPKPPSGPAASSGKTPVGKRNDTLFREAIRLRRSGAGEEKIAEHLQTFNALRCIEPLPAREVAAIAKSAAGYDSDENVDAEPEPLRRPLAASKPYPLDALGLIIGDAVKSIARVIQCPESMAANSILAASSLAAQAHADVKIDGRCYPLSLWLLTVAASGERKSAVDAQATAAHREYERQMFEQYRIELQKYTIARQVFENACKLAHQRNKTAETLQAGLIALGVEPQPPLLPHLFAADPTIEGLHKMLAISQPSVGMFNDEGGQVFGGFGMRPENISKSAAGLSKLWDAGVVDRVRAIDGATKLYGKRVALHLMMQPVIAGAVLSNEVLAGQGFLARCLIAAPESTAGNRAYVEADLSQDPAMLTFYERMRVLLSHAPRLRDGTRSELDPRALELTPSAKEVWTKVYNFIEARCKTDGRYAQVRAFASKAAEQVLRIGGVLAIIENST
ncbi:MAG: DUF3987 domain-containing protein, partial [Proteobacteria bacterium]|nr:DUF3987 domain-containing protein [Pseudomonadota bacterium]